MILEQHERWIRSKELLGQLNAENASFEALAISAMAESLTALTPEGRAAAIAEARAWAEIGLLRTQRLMQVTGEESMSLVRTQLDQISGGDSRA